MDKLKFYPALTGGKTPTSKFSWIKEVRWEPVKARLVALDEMKYIDNKCGKISLQKINSEYENFCLYCGNNK
ncbi:hypothetical protein IGI01_12665 [Bacillus thuringiensis]|nr:hypothetical protein [Bacillus thuringiensis]